jgi:adenylate kinase family enzyme
MQGSSANASIGRRVLVIGMAGSGKSTFSRALSARTGLPVVHLDVHYWKPGWVKPSDTEWREQQRGLLAGDAWIADGNYYETADIPLERAATVVLLDMPWWLSAWRAFVRGLRRPEGKLPAGCEDSAVRRLRDEWWLIGRAWMGRRSEPAEARALVSKHGADAEFHVLRSKRDASEFLSHVTLRDPD